MVSRGEMIEPCRDWKMSTPAQGHVDAYWQLTGAQHGAGRPVGRWSGPMMLSLMWKGYLGDCQDLPMVPVPEGLVVWTWCGMRKLYLGWGPSRRRIEYAHRLERALHQQMCVCSSHQTG